MESNGKMLFIIILIIYGSIFTTLYFLKKQENNLSKNELQAANEIKRLNTVALSQLDNEKRRIERDLEESKNNSAELSQIIENKKSKIKSDSLSMVFLRSKIDSYEKLYGTDSFAITQMKLLDNEIKRLSNEKDLLREKNDSLYIIISKLDSMRIANNYMIDSLSHAVGDLIIINKKLSDSLKISKKINTLLNVRGEFENYQYESKSLRFSFLLYLDNNEINALKNIGLTKLSLVTTIQNMQDNSYLTTGNFMQNNISEIKVDEILNPINISYKLRDIYNNLFKKKELNGKVKGIPLKITIKIPELNNFVLGEDIF